MRTTLEMDQDVLIAAKEIAVQQRVSVGKVLSGLARCALTRPAEGATHNGIPVFPRQPSASIVTLELVNRLRDEES